MKIRSTKLLFLYRSFLFKFVKFETENKELKTIVKALNIKKKKQRIEYVYDKAIEYINKYYKEDLCKFKNDQCIVQRNNKKEEKYGCCLKCPIVTDKGCPSSNLACKLIYCKTALDNLKLLRLRDIPILKCLSILQRATLKGDFFQTKEEILKDLYYGPIYSSFRITIKELTKIIKTKKV